MEFYHQSNRPHLSLRWELIYYEAYKSRGDATRTRVSHLNMSPAQIVILVNEVHPESDSGQARMTWGKVSCETRVEEKECLSMMGEQKQYQTVMRHFNCYTFATFKMIH